jgi:ribosomal protein L11 methyltransferase
MRIAVLVVPAHDAELAADRLWGAGASALEEREVADGVEFRTVLARDDDLSAARLGPLGDGWTLSFADVDPTPSTAWRAFAEPIRVGERLVIRPAWVERTAPAGVLDVAIDPGASFGLGDHPTTRLAAAATDRLAGPGDRVLDVGCGSGVLGIVAARRGASRVVSIDISDAACEATFDNARRNGVVDVFEISSAPVAEVDGSFDLVVANILAPVLVAMAPDLRRLTDVRGHLVVSGVLAERSDHVAAALAPMTVASTSQMGEWASVTFRHP